MSFLIALCLFTNCKKEPIHYTIPDELKQLSVFNKGSYWIYINEKTSVLDSTYVKTDPDFYTLGINDKDNSPLYDAVIVTVVSSFLHDYYTQFTSIIIDFKRSFGTAFEIDAKVGQKYGSSHDIFELINYFDSISLNNQIYKSVFFTRNTIVHDLVDTIKYDFYLAKNIGLIRLEKKYLNADTTWSLVRYHLLQ